MNYYIRFWKDFNDLRLQHQSNVVENVVVLDNAFNHTQVDEGSSNLLKI